MKTRYSVCGLGYNQDYSINDYTQDFGDFDTYEEAYELFVKLQCRSVESFFTNASNVCQMMIQVEVCNETKDYIECVDVRNEWWIVNPNFKEEN